MATVFAIGTNQNGWTKGSGGTKTLANKGAFNYGATGLPGTATGRNILSSLAEANSLCLAFFGASTGKKARVRIWGFNAIGTVASPQPVIGVFLAELEVTLGTTPYTGGVFGTTSVYLAHTIEVVDDATNTPPGIRLVGAIDPVDEALATMLFDSMGFSAIVIETQDLSPSGASLGPIWRPI